MLCVCVCGILKSEMEIHSPLQEISKKNDENRNNNNSNYIKRCIDFQISGEQKEKPIWLWLWLYLALWL